MNTHIWYALISVLLIALIVGGMVVGMWLQDKWEKYNDQD